VSLRSSRSSVPRRRAAFVAVAVLGLVTLTGCNLDLHPGVAATVSTDDNGQKTSETIQQASVDDVVTAACGYINAANKGASQPTTIATNDLRSNVLSSLVAYDVIDAATKALGLTVYPADIATQASQTQMPAGLSDSDKNVLTGFFYKQSKAQVQQAVIGAHLKDPSVTTSAGVDINSASDAASYVIGKLKAADVDVNPQFGEWNGQTVATASGSLSDPVSPSAKSLLTAQGTTNVENLPASMVCGLG
jgi:hypothetical protein